MKLSSPSGAMSLALLRGPLSRPCIQQCRSFAHNAASSSTTPKPQTSPSPSTDLSTQVRLLMRRVPYPVTIITATDPTHPPSAQNRPQHHHHHHHKTQPTFRGMTVSSLNTVTLTPSPILSFNVKRPSETLSALRSSRRFLAHLLAPNPATAALARDFSRGNQGLDLGKVGFEFLPYQYEGGSGTGTRDPGVGGVLPVLRRRMGMKNGSSTTGESADAEEDFPFIFECKVLEQEIEVHDHTIVLGTVVRALAGGSLRDIEPAAHGQAKDLCLTYADTRFWGMGTEI